MYNVYNNDCLEVMNNNLLPHSIDLVLVDPPYGVTASKWDQCIPIAKMWACLDRVCKENANILVFSSDPFSAKVISSNIDSFKYSLIWLKNTSANYTHAKNMPLKNVEYIHVFSKCPIGHKSLLGDKRMIYNPQGVTSTNEKGRGLNKTKEWGLRKTSNKFMGARPSHKAYYKPEGCGYPNQVLKYDVVHNNKKVHVNEKPIKLLEYLINTFSYENATVLDFAMGSATCGCACINTSRNFIGIEKDLSTYELALHRLKHHKKGALNYDGLK